MILNFIRFSRGAVETTLPPIRHIRAGRLCRSFEKQIQDLEKDASLAQEHIQNCQKRKRVAEENVNNLQESIRRVKVILRHFFLEFFNKSLSLACVIIFS